MNITNNSGNFESQSKQEIENMIRKSSRNHCDDIWISGAAEYPSLAILVNGIYACVHYFLNEKGDIWQSVGDSDKDTAFIIGDGNADFAPYEATISLEKAIECMSLFFDDLQKPNCIEWREL